MKRRYKVWLKGAAEVIEKHAKQRGPGIAGKLTAAPPKPPGKSGWVG